MAATLARRQILATCAASLYPRANGFRASPPSRPRARRDPPAGPAQSRFRNAVHRSHGRDRLRCRQGRVAPGDIGPARSNKPRSRGCCPALCAGNLRRHESLQARGRIACAVPARAECAPLQRKRAAHGDARTARRPVPRIDPSAGCQGPRLGTGRPRWFALPAPVHVRLGGISRRATRASVQIHPNCIAGRALFQGGRQAGEDLGQPQLHPRRARRHRCRQNGRQLRGQPRAPGRRHREWLRPGGLPRRGREEMGRGTGRDEPVLRL